MVGQLGIVHSESGYGNIDVRNDVSSESSTKPNLLNGPVTESGRPTPKFADPQPGPATTARRAVLTCASDTRCSSVGASLCHLRPAGLAPVAHLQPRQRAYPGLK